MKIMYGVIIDDALMVESDIRESMEDSYRHSWEEREDGSAVFAVEIDTIDSISGEDIVKRIIELKSGKDERANARIRKFDKLFEKTPYEIRECQEHSGPEIIIVG